MRLRIKPLLPFMIAGAATLVASAQASFEKTYRFSINYSSNEVTITGVREGVKLQGDIQIPGSYTSTRDGVKYTVTSLRGNIDDAEFGMPRPVFENQDEITSIYIPSTIDDIVVDTFRGCKRLKEFKVSSQSKTFKAVDGVLYYIRSEDSVDMMRFPPARTSTGFTLPDEAGYILEGAFADNYTITTLRLSKWQLLETGALDGNLGITRFELNGHYLYKTNAGGDYLVDKNDPGVLIAVAPRYKMGEQLVIPSSIHTIGWYALAGNRAKSISIPSTVKSIGGYAFTGTSLESVTIPATVTDIPDTEGLFYN
ncbi:MAG: leucine-rich repeat domain-containing protein, partial [Muribaculaceae bacterium]|nr:leucine-rich repeat domain-containing protein [Muribaculaceae bacterium]